MLRDRPTLVKKGESFEDIRSRLGMEIFETIEKFGFAKDKDGNPNPKMALSLVHVIALAVEISMGQQTIAYVTTRLNEQIDRYIALGFHSVAGYTREAFRTALAPLVAKTLDFFKPPSERPLRDGEFSVLLVLPTTWVSRRRLLAALLGDDLADDVAGLSPPELRMRGKASPDAPYVLVGIKGGRGLKEHSIAEADAVVERASDTYLSLPQLVQLLLVRPNFLSAESDLVQSEVFVLGEKWNTELVRLVATKQGIAVELSPEKNIHGGRGVGKPHYAKMITV